MSKRKRLPIGIQNFDEVRRNGHYYVDKTTHVAKLIDRGKHYFLSRPRRFGKSLLIDTIKELFEGNEELFRGLHIHNRWDWATRYPVVRLSFGGRAFTTPDSLRLNLSRQLDSLEREFAVERAYATAPERFAHLIETLHRLTGQRVVVLVDEYDKPILDPLSDPAAASRDLARANRDALRGVYGNVKDLDACIRFSLLAGVSKFSKASLFSGLNNLLDITLDPRYASICGYTEEDLGTVFAPELDGLDRDDIRDWYNGYSWLGPDRVYNPFDILLLFDSRRFRAYWFETGSPSFLVRTLTERGVGPLRLDGMVASDALLSAIDVGHMSTEALLFQTGYLTIVEERNQRGRTSYRLGFPNREVRESLNECLLQAIGWRAVRALEARDNLYDLLCAPDFPGLENYFRALFAAIPYNWHVRNDIARFEGYYASVMYACFATLSVDVTVEDAGATGRLDLTVRVGGRIFLFEFKVVEEADRGAALAQLLERGYADKYRALGEPIHLVGVEFSRERRNLAAFEVANWDPPWREPRQANNF